MQAVVEGIRALGGEAVAIVADSGNESEVIAASQQISQLGPLKAAIFNVGNSVAAPTLELSAQLFEQTWRASTLGGFLFAREATRLLLASGGGSLLFTGATASLRGKPPFVRAPAADSHLQTLPREASRQRRSQAGHGTHTSNPHHRLGSRLRH